MANFNYIIDPSNGTQYSIFTNEGKLLLKQYVNYYQSNIDIQIGGFLWPEEKRKLHNKILDLLSTGKYNIINISEEETDLWYYIESKKNKSSCWKEVEHYLKEIQKAIREKLADPKRYNNKKRDFTYKYRIIKDMDESKLRYILGGSATGDGGGGGGGGSAAGDGSTAGVGSRGSRGSEVSAGSRGSAGSTDSWVNLSASEIKEQKKAKKKRLQIERALKNYTSPNINLNGKENKLFNEPLYKSLLYVPLSFTSLRTKDTWNLQYTLDDGQTLYSLKESVDKNNSFCIIIQLNDSSGPIIGALSVDPLRFTPLPSNREGFIFKNENQNAKVFKIQKNPDGTFNHTTTPWDLRERHLLFGAFTLTENDGSLSVIIHAENNKYDNDEPLLDVEPNTAIPVIALEVWNLL
jgi:hypothetical protein